MSEYRVDVKVRNNLILKHIEKMGFPGVIPFCKNYNLNHGTLYDYVNMKEAIFDKKGEIKKFIWNLCEIFVCSPEDIFTENQMTAELETNKRTYEIKEAEVEFFLQNKVTSNCLEEIIEKEEKNKILERALDNLTPREKMVLKLRHGIEGEEHTLAQCAERAGVSRERLRQIESKALRKLRYQAAWGELSKLREGE